jgi:hypothetical protein
MTKVVQFSSKRFIRSVTLMAKIFAAIVALLLTVLMLGGQYLVGRVQDFTVAQDVKSGYIPVPCSLFPGANLTLIDILYYIFLLLVVIFVPVSWCLSQANRTDCDDDNLTEESYIGYAVRWLWARPYLFLFVFPTLFGAMHLFANLHWAVWCGFGVIPEHNCFMVFDYRSLLVAPAGIIGCVVVLATLALIAAACYCAFRAVCWCCCFELVEKPLTENKCG